MTSLIEEHLGGDDGDYTTERLDVLCLCAYIRTWSIKSTGKIPGTPVFVYPDYYHPVFAFPSNIYNRTITLLIFLLI